jgi:hypothetical protein
VCHPAQAWLRVALRFHTWPQVLAGAALGAGSAAAWFQAGTRLVLPALQQSRAGLAALYVLTGLGAAALAARIVSGWKSDVKQQQQQQQQQQSGQMRARHRQGQQEAAGEESACLLKEAAAAAAAVTDGSGELQPGAQPVRVVTAST